MADEKVTLEQLAEYMQRQLPMTYNLFEQNREDDVVYNAASWARGRIDAFLQILQILDEDRTEMLRAEWQRVVSGKGFMSEGGE
jgi:hypothetical protein